MIDRERVQKTFCTTREAAELLGISLRTAQLWVESGLLEAWKTNGGHRRIDRQSVERLIAKPTEQERQSVTLQAPTPTPRIVPSLPAQPLNVLVVEDEPALRRIYELTLARWPLRPNVESAADGYEALLRIGHLKPDLLITDLRMPGMDGFRMLRTIRSMQELSAMNIVVVTGLHPEEITDLGGLPEGIPVLPKPIPFPQLLQIAEAIAAKRHLVAQ